MSKAVFVYKKKDAPEAPPAALPEPLPVPEEVQIMEPLVMPDLEMSFKSPVKRLSISTPSKRPSTKRKSLNRTTEIDGYNASLKKETDLLMTEEEAMEEEEKKKERPKPLVERLNRARAEQDEAPPPPKRRAAHKDERTKVFDVVTRKVREGLKRAHNFGSRGHAEARCLRTAAARFERMLFYEWTSVKRHNVDDQRLGELQSTVMESLKERIGVVERELAGWERVASENGIELPPRPEVPAGLASELAGESVEEERVSNLLADSVVSDVAAMISAAENADVPMGGDEVTVSDVVSGVDALVPEVHRMSERVQTAMESLRMSAATLRGASEGRILRPYEVQLPAQNYALIPRFNA